MAPAGNNNEEDRPQHARWTIDSVDSRYQAFIAVLYGGLGASMLAVGVRQWSEDCDQPLQMMLVLIGAMCAACAACVVAVPLLVLMGKIKSHLGSFKTEGDFDTLLSDALHRKSAREAAHRGMAAATAAAGLSRDNKGLARPRRSAGNKVGPAEPEGNNTTHQKPGDEEGAAVQAGPTLDYTLDVVSYASAFIYGCLGLPLTQAFLALNYFYFSTSDCEAHVQRMALSFLLTVYGAVAVGLLIPFVILYLRAEGSNEMGFVGSLKRFVSGRPLTQPVKKFPLV